jgi:hypothetical protein
MGVQLTYRDHLHFQKKPPIFAHLQRQLVPAHQYTPNQWNDGDD